MKKSVKCVMIFEEAQANLMIPVGSVCAIKRWKQSTVVGHLKISIRVYGISQMGL